MKPWFMPVGAPALIESIALFHWEMKDSVSEIEFVDCSVQGGQGEIVSGVARKPVQGFPDVQENRWDPAETDSVPKPTALLPRRSSNQ